MSLFWIIQIVSVVGVAAVIALTWAVGWGRTTKIASLEDASARFARDFPAATIKGGALGTDGRAAVLDLGEGFGLVTVLGDEFVTRKLGAGNVIVNAGAGLTIELSDPTLPRVRLALSKFDAGYWQAAFGVPLTSPLEGEVGSRSEPGGGRTQEASGEPPSLTLPLKGGGNTASVPR